MIEPNKILAFGFNMHQCKIAPGSLEFQMLNKVNMFVFLNKYTQHEKYFVEERRNLLLLFNDSQTVQARRRKIFK